MHSAIDNGLQKDTTSITPGLVYTEANLWRRQIGSHCSHQSQLNQYILRYWELGLTFINLLQYTRQPRAMKTEITLIVPSVMLMHLSALHALKKLELEEFSFYLRDKSDQASNCTKNAKTETNNFVVYPRPYMRCANPTICNFIICIHMFLFGVHKFLETFFEKFWWSQFPVGTK